MDGGVVGSHDARFFSGIHKCGEEADNEEDGETFREFGGEAKGACVAEEGER